ncbi:MAG: divergent PAP2 family protein [Candidatus Saganbacteria bacterium]|nr:divergent PAP2 family protein [Candidatus Saganbacteria bacterium]
MKVLFEILKNYPLMSSLLAMFLGQAFKIVYYYMIDKKLEWRHFLESGGMPSAHSAMATSLAVSVGIWNGWCSSQFAISVAFSCIVMYDAVGVRRATGAQSIVLNRILEDLYKSGRISSEKLHEFMGHTPLEVLAGLIFGLIISLLMYFGVYSFVA